MSGHGRPVVVRRVERPEPAVIEGLAAMGSATVHEAIGRRGFLGPDIRPIQSGTRIAGPAVTALCHPGDNLMIHAAVETCQPGDILVVAVSAPSPHGFFGDLLATSAQARGVRGLVIDAGVRDTAELRAMGFPGWSRHVSCQGTVKATAGSVNVPVVLGGQTVGPGDVCALTTTGWPWWPAPRPGGRWRCPASGWPRRRKPGPGLPPASWVSTCTACASS